MKYDATQYQGMVRGQLVSVSDMTKKEARQEACACMELIELLEDKITEMTDLIGKYRDGVQIPQNND